MVKINFSTEPRRIEKQYKITKYFTDNYPVYKELIPHNKHKIGKQFTRQIENLNGRIKHYIKGFNGRSKSYFKIEKIAVNVLKLFFCGDVN